MAYVLFSGRSLTRHTGRACLPPTAFSCEQRRHYVEKPEKPKTRSKARKSEPREDSEARPEHKEFLEWVEQLGLGKTDGSAEWRDQKLEAKVAELFRQTMDASRKLGANLHPTDVEARDSAKDAQLRIAQRIAELREIDLDRSQRLLMLLFEEPLNRLKFEAEEEIKEGAIPGTINAPWSKNPIWKFFDQSLLVPDTKIRQADTNESRDIVPEGKTLDYDGNLRKLEQLENPVVWHDPKTNKKTCIFCSEERHLYPLEPMNVPLLMKFMTPGGFIKKRKQTGLCRTMQARVARTIKQARSLGLFSYKGQTFRVKNPMIPYFDDGEEDVDEFEEEFTEKRGETEEEEEFNEKEYRAYLKSLEKTQ